MKLIDADSLKTSLCVRCMEYAECRKTGSELPVVCSWKKAIDAAPAIDAVPVVRCKDCKWYRAGELFTDKKMCYRHAIVRGIGKIVTDDEDFCSFGVRKEVQNETN